eukprot:scaffold9085_cov92-Cylindrotheca_fusiformis.AAC.1
MAYKSQSIKPLDALAPRRAGSHVRTEKLYVSWYIKAREIQGIKHHHANNNNGKATYICLLAPTFSSQQIECMSTNSQRMFFQRIAGAVLNGPSTPRTKRLADFCEIHGTRSCFRDGSGWLIEIWGINQGSNSQLTRKDTGRGRGVFTVAGSVLQDIFDFFLTIIRRGPAG